MASFVVAPVVPQMLGNGPIDLDIRSRVEALMKEQAAVLRSERTIDAAVARAKVSAEEGAAFRKALTIEQYPDLRVLEIVVHGEVPRALALCMALVDGYMSERLSAALPGAGIREVQVLDGCRSRVVIHPHWWNREEPYR